MNTHLSFDQKVEKAAQVVERATEQNQEDSLKHVWNMLSRLGITKDNKESHTLIEEGFCKQGDARAEFCENINMSSRLTVPWFNKIWSILSPSEQGAVVVPGDTTSKIIQAFADQRPHSQWKDDKLIAEYGDDCSPDVIEELEKRSKGKRVVAFDDGNNVNKDITFELLRRARKGKSLPNEIYRSEGKIYRLWYVGEFPSEVEDESPLATGSTLFNGMCTEYDVDFSEVSTEARQFVRVIRSEGKSPGRNDRVGLRGLIDAAKAGIEELKDLYPKVWVKFDELKRTDQLPSLKKITVEKNGSSSQNDPFGGNTRS